MAGLVWAAASGAPAAHAASLVVDTLSDTDDATDGACSLREAIIAANANANHHECTGTAFGDDTIAFTGTGTIALASTLPTITDSAGLTIDGGGAITVDGGGRVRVMVSGARFVLRNITIAHGSGPRDPGGLWHNGTGLLSISNSRFVGNTGLGGGALTASRNSDVEIIDTTFSGNSAGAGGAIQFGGGDGAGVLRVTGSTFEKNTASAAGGAINAVAAIITNSTFSGNTAREGGALALPVAATVRNSTVAGNGASRAGGGIIAYRDAVVTLENTIVADSTAGDNCAVEDSATIIDGGGNLSWPDATCPGINDDPVLGLLADNDGATQTLALGPDSAALDAALTGTCPPTDQRGVDRPQGTGCDIGAYELVPTGPTCFGLVPTILGTEGNDVLIGTNGADVIMGLGGNDIIRGRGGDDVICGGDGNDILEGGDGDDRLDGGKGNDILRGGNGDDVLLGGEGNDTLEGGPGDDELDGGPGTDILKGQAGLDSCLNGENVQSCD